jgi:hypothetical protein
MRGGAGGGLADWFDVYPGKLAGFFIDDCWPMDMAMV